MNNTFEVKGMSCVICKKTVEEGLSELKGVNSCQVNLMDNEVIIEYDEKIVNENDFKDVLNKLGYELVTSKNKKINHKKITLIVSIILETILITISLLYMRKGIDTKILQLLISIIIYSIDYRYFKKGLLALYNRKPNMDTLVSISSLVSFLYSIYSLLKLANGYSGYHLYFESGSMILVIVSIGKAIEEKNKKKTTKVIKGLSALIPMNANKLVNNEIIVVPTETLKKNDTILVKTNESIPQDGMIIKGSGTIDESLITGESIETIKMVNSEVIGGTVLTSGEIEVQITKESTQTLLSRIISLTKQASIKKIPIERFADQVSKYFVLSVILISALTFTIWLIVSNNFEISMNFALSVLVVACPCSLGLATPSAIAVACSKSTKEGVLIKNPEVLEYAYKMNSIIFDKTGTLTDNTLTIADERIYDDNFHKILSSLEANSNHPIARTIKLSFNSEIKPMETQEILGMGITSNNYWAGNKELATKFNAIIKQEDLLYADDNSYTYVLVGNNDKVLGIIYFSDKIKSTSIEAINLLKEKDIRITMCTGDNEKVAKAVSNKLGIDNYHANIKPQDKKEYVIKEKENGIVAMVGDGVNDAIALTSSDISFSLSTATDIAQVTSDAVLLHNDIRDIAFFINLSKLTMKKIKQNLLWAMLYNSLLIPVAAGCLYPTLGISLNPMICSIAMTISSIFVLINALSISTMKKSLGNMSSK